MKGVEFNHVINVLRSFAAFSYYFLGSKLIDKAWIYLPSVIKVAETANNFRNNVSSCMS